MPTPAKWILSLVLAWCVIAPVAPASAADVGVSISVGDPRFYGRIDLGAFPSPVLIYDEPVVVIRRPQYAYAPVYLRVPPRHRRDWHRHCHRYEACARPVYFVDDDWYREAYVVRRHKWHDDDDDDDDRRHHRKRHRHDRDD